MGQHEYTGRPVRGARRTLVAPAWLRKRLPLSSANAALVASSRQEVSAIVRGTDDRLLVVVGPCSVHDPAAALAYARRLRAVAPELAPELRLIMRGYCEKPRTTLGWKGLINDPYLDGSCAVDHGLQVARELLRDILTLGLPVGYEFLDPLTAGFLADAVTWGSIGARTTESQVHRQLASGLPMPIGFKNGTSGNVQAAVDGVRAAAHSHTFLSITAHGRVAVATTQGNPDAHVILRGGGGSSNYDQHSIRRTLDALRAGGLPPRLMIDASHDNSGKDPRRQPYVVHAVAGQIAAGEAGIIGLMLESFLVEGRQDLGDPAGLTFGQSITDACLSWETTQPLLLELAAAVRARRAAHVPLAA